ncbi:E3 ubiquitin-protein ligase rnf213-alpha-like [Salmo salar]|uniref:E3 ubiquitin-protein ligase rnf213-alpha-like n=1 Tax=Salmo salar TaxID=8030 RepID=A0ABM3EH81_SALSA|nr:E3 ubiquitin-protein ligase rnf213-alpha-like [Salmo salar]
MGGLSVLADRSSVEHTLIELVVHMSAVLLTGTEGLLTPLQQLGLSPNNMLSAFLPTMPEDMLAVAQRLITQSEVDYGLSWYSCPNGHPCVVDKCGQPTHKAQCLECRVEIGGENHVPLTGFQKMELQQGDLTRTGHILGDPQRRDNPDTLDTKNMSLTPFILVRLLGLPCGSVGRAWCLQRLHGVSNARVVECGLRQRPYGLCIQSKVEMYTPD